MPTTSEPGAPVGDDNGDLDFGDEGARAPAVPVPPLPPSAPPATSAPPAPPVSMPVTSTSTPQGAPPVPDLKPPAGTTSIVNEPVVPTTVDPSLTGETLAPWIYVRARHNLPAWKNTEGGILTAARFNGFDPDSGDPIGDPLNPDECYGWVPNNEEGVHAVELGFVELADVPAGTEPPEA